MNLRHGLKIAKELVGVSITALAAAIADEVKEYDVHWGNRVGR